MVRTWVLGGGDEDEKEKEMAAAKEDQETKRGSNNVAAVTDPAGLFSPLCAKIKNIVAEVTQWLQGKITALSASVTNYVAGPQGVWAGVQAIPWALGLDD
jgi:hypothetical protein